MSKIRKTIGFTPIVEEINRKFTIRKETCSLKKVGNKELPAKSWMGSATRTHVLAGYGTVRVPYFVFRKNPNLSLPSASQLKVKTAFTAASKWVTAANKDLMVLAQNMQKFTAAKEDLTKKIKGISVAGYTYRGWMFAIAFKMQYNGETLPVDHALPSFDN